MWNWYFAFSIIEHEYAFSVAKPVSNYLEHRLARLIRTTPSQRITAEIARGPFQGLVKSYSQLGPTIPLEKRLQQAVWVFLELLYKK